MTNDLLFINYKLLLGLRQKLGFAEIEGIMGAGWGVVDGAGRSIRELEAIRDECMVAVQRVLKKYDMGSGATLNEFERRLRAKAEQG